MEYGERITAVSDFYFLFLLNNCSLYFLFCQALAEPDGEKTCQENA
jgi:hypothetical protein